jgi:Uncharacterized protein conserved in bacteria (DUF2188)
MNRKARHVVPNPGGGWSVRHSGASRASKVFDKQADAVRYGREIAQKERTELYVHRSDGTIKLKDSFGVDPLAPRAKR